MIIEQTELRRKRAGSEGAGCAVVRVRVLGQREGVWTGGGGSFSSHSPHCSLHSSGDDGGYTVGRGH